MGVFPTHALFFRFPFVAQPLHAAATRYRFPSVLHSRSKQPKNQDTICRERPTPVSPRDVPVPLSERRKKEAGGAGDGALRRSRHPLPFRPPGRTPQIRPTRGARKGSKGKAFALRTSIIRQRAGVAPQGFWSAVAAGAARRRVVWKLQDPYAILGVSATTSLADAKRAYRRKALKTHPDMGGSVEQFTLVHAAYEAILAGRSTLNPDPDPPPQPHAYPASAYTYEHFKQVDMTSLPEAMFIYRNMTIYTRRGGRKSVLESGDRWYGGPNGQRNHEVIVHESDRLAAHFASPMSSRHAAGFHFDTDVSFAKRQYFKAAKHRMLCGYCGWAPGKLDVLIAKGRWKLVESDSVWLHNTPPEELYEAALRLPTHPID
eukprot:gene3980-6172_t